LVGFVAEQLGLTPGAFAEYAARDQTRREHAAELQALLGLRRFGFPGWRDCLRAGTEPASNFRPLNDVRTTSMPRAA
jgi:hypothetical protein